MAMPSAITTPSNPNCSRRISCSRCLWDEGYTKLEEALKQGFITEKELDQAVLRVLTLKFEQGLMDKPYIDENGNRTASYSENGAVSFPTD